eukprot:363376-Chlamydomonas_euryale.AAC.3
MQQKSNAAAGGHRGEQVQQKANAAEHICRRRRTQQRATTREQTQQKANAAEYICRRRRTQQRATTREQTQQKAEAGVSKRSRATRREQTQQKADRSSNTAEGREVGDSLEQTQQRADGNQGEAGAVQRAPHTATHQVDARPEVIGTPSVRWNNHPRWTLCDAHLRGRREVARIDGLGGRFARGQRCGQA